MTRFPVRLAASLLVLSAAGAAVAQPAPAPAAAGAAQIPFETYKLPNGLNVILSRDASVPVVAVNLWYHVGSANEQPGRTGFAHLFEHMMFQGSENVGDDQHFKRIQEAGGTLNGSTNPDRTNYYQATPSNFLETLLWLEADRMGFLLPSMTEEKLDNQRSVVQNERRQRYENAPYGLAYETMSRAMYPEGHPYSWTTIGSMEDLNAASMEDVQSFFRTYYAPNNASLAIVGDFDPAEAKRLVEKYFADIPQGPAIERPSLASVRLESPKALILEDRVQLPRLYLAWHSPAQFAEGDAEMDVLGRVLAGGKNSRLYRRLVYEDQTAQWVSAYQSSRPLGGQFQITVQAKPGVNLARVQKAVDEEVARLKTEPPTQRELERALNNIESQYVQGVQTVLGKADQLNAFYTWTGDPGYGEKAVARYRTVTPQGVQAAAGRYLDSGRVALSVVPQGQTELRASR
ncbi:MAG: insulinase family protein [Gemmatimonadota bacterium]|nr:insulinase family protein [Gemmatimonadota bacterium]